MSKFIDSLKKAYQYIDGNKTIMGLIAMNIFERWPLHEPAQSIVLLIIYIWTGIASYDHFVTKKSLSPNYK